MMDGDKMTTYIQFVLGLVVLIPTVIVLSILGLRGDSWASYTLAAMGGAVLTLFGFKVTVNQQTTQAIRGRLKIAWGAMYRWFWKEFLCRLEPFTTQFIRMAKKWPWVWFALPLFTIVGVAYSVYKRHWFAVVVWFLLSAGLILLIIHLGGFL
jgi:hypothetical protein